MTHPNEPTNLLHQVRFLFWHSAPLTRFVADPTAAEVARLWSEVLDGLEEPIAVCVVAPAAGPGKRAGANA